MNSKHRKTLAAIFASPTPAGIKWREVESLLMALGATRSEGPGSRVRFVLNGERASFHRPHPPPATGQPTIRSVRDFLTNAGATP